MNKQKQKQIKNFLREQRSNSIYQDWLYLHRIREGTYVTLRSMFSKDIANEIMSWLFINLRCIQRDLKRDFHRGLFGRTMKFLIAYHNDPKSIIYRSPDKLWFRVPRNFFHLIEEIENGDRKSYVLTSVIQNDYRHGLPGYHFMF